MILIHDVTPQKYTMAGSSQFVPSLNAITTNQDLQWLVQPSLMHPPGPSRSPAPPYPAVAGARPLGPTLSHSHFLRPGVIRASATTAAASTRRRTDDHVRMMFLKSLSWLKKKMCLGFSNLLYLFFLNNFLLKGLFSPECVTSDFKVWAINDCLYSMQHPVVPYDTLTWQSTYKPRKRVQIREELTKDLVIYSKTCIICGHSIDDLIRSTLFVFFDVYFESVLTQCKDLQWHDVCVFQFQLFFC